MSDLRRPSADLLALRIQKLFWLARRRKRWALLRKRIAPSLEHSEMFVGSSFATVIDIGSNLGQFAIWAAESLDAKHIVCVEPLPDSSRQLEQLASFLKPSQVEVLNVALGATSGNKTLHITAASDSSSLLPPVAEEAGGALREVGTHTVRVCVGDDVLTGPYTRPILVKIDVQGSELDVLNGIPQLLSNADAVLVEVSFASLYDGQADPSAVVANLLDAGFTLTAVARVPGSSQSWGLDQADLLFERR